MTTQFLANLIRVPTSDGKTGNQETVTFLKKFARCAGVDLEARIVDVSAVEITYIHNKG